jgi:competence ComEA-like helix-hairpin-helix protein
MWRKALNLWFSFSRSERTGVIVLLVLIGAVSGLRWYVGLRPSEGVAKPTAAQLAEVKDFRQSLYRKRQAIEQSQTKDTRSEEKPSTKEEAKKPEGPVMVSVNRANAGQLQRIKGIGPALSRRIIDYRQRLGGFCQAGQLREVKGIGAKTLEKMVPHVVLDTNAIRKLSLKNSTADELAAHPYVSAKLAEKIIAERQNGDLKPADLLKNGLISKKDWQRLRHYLKP